MPKAKAKAREMTLVEHLQDLRKTLIIAILAWLIFTAAAFFLYQEQIFGFLTLPIQEMDLKLVIITPFEGFMAKFKAASFAGLFFALPIILWQVWRFILPALETKEKRYLLVIVPISLIFFISGVAFSYYFVLGIALNFLIITAGSGFIPMLGASKYLGFVIAMLLPFGIVFQLPLAALFLTRIGLINHKMMSKKRKYAIVIIFIIAAVLTPTPDVVTQSIMAIPMLILYELSIIISWLFRKKVKVSESDEMTEMTEDNEVDKVHEVNDVNDVNESSIINETNEDSESNDIDKEINKENDSNDVNEIS